MENCLLTTLKAAVQNENLSKLGVLRVHIIKKDTIGSNDDRLIISPVSGSSITIKIVGNTGGFSTTSTGPRTTTEITISSETSLWFANETYDVEVSNKYAIKMFYAAGLAYGSIISCNINELVYSGHLYNLSFNDDHFTGDIKSIKNMSELYIYEDSTGSEVYGSLAEMMDGNTLGEISMLKMQYNNHVSGVLSEVGGLVSLATLYPSKLITGSIEDFADAQLAAGRTSGSVVVKGNNLITYNGQTFTSTKTITYSGGSYTVS